jgi:hypothetical protein
LGRKLLLAVALGLPLACIARSAPAATITWGAATTVDPSDVTQVLTNGSFVDAATLSSTTTLNSVTFNGFSGFTTGLDLQTDANFGSSNIKLLDLDNMGPLGAGPATAYGTMLNSGAYRSTGDTPGFATIVLGGLTPGVSYQAQVWAPYWNAAFSMVLAAGNISPTLNTGVGGGNPQFVVGTFTADGMSESITATGTPNFALISAVSVREISGVPEPSSVAMAVVALIGLMAFAGRSRG